MKRNWLMHDNTGSVKAVLVICGDGSVRSGTDRYLVVLGQYNLVLLGISGTGSEQSFYACIY